MDDRECAQKLSFLFSASFISLPTSYVKLRNILNLHSSNIAGIFNLKLPKYFTSNNMSCPYCYTQWNHNFNSFKLLPSTGKKFKKEISSNTLIDDTAECVLCTKNKLILKCQVCTNKTKFILEKPENYRDENQKYITNAILKKKKIQNLFKGKLIHQEGNKKIKKKKLEKKRLLNPNSNSVVVSKSITSNKNSQQNKNQSFTKLGPKELKQEREHVLQLNSKQRLFKIPFNKNNSAKSKKKQLNRLKKAIKNEANIAKNSFKDLLTVMNK